MKKKIFLILILLISNSIPGQSRDVEYDYYAYELSEIEINEILNYPITDLNNVEAIMGLRRKLNSDLNTIASITVNYKFAKTLKLTSDEQTELEKLMIEIADKFAAHKKYVLIKLTGGYSPVFGIKEETLSNKKILTLMLGGDCVTDEMEIKQEKIYELFNEQMKKNIAK
jgi:hypothetical protein